MPAIGLRLGTTPDAYDKNTIRVWIASFLLLLASELAFGNTAAMDFKSILADAAKTIPPLLFCILATRIAPHQQVVIYLLFFSISLTSLFGFTKTLTGSHSSSGNVFLYGLSFYSASLAFLIHQNRVGSSTAFAISNPLLLITGPIAIQFKNIRQRSTKNRINYYFPFVVLGLFLHQGIATPITQTFILLEKTDVVSSLLFAVIFELFVYANFCGLSLVVFGALGILGLRVPLNFRQPFSATNLIDFWKGWHTSLSTVLKALFYVPARKRIGANGAILSVFLASSLWHGVSLNFLIWGGLHAILFALTRYFLQKGEKIVPFILFVVGVILGRLIFADAETNRLLEKLTFHWGSIAGLQDLHAAPQASKRAIVLMAIFVAVEFFCRKHPLFKQRNYKFYRIPFIQLILLIFTLSTISDMNGIDYAVYGQR